MQSIYYKDELIGIKIKGFPKGSVPGTNNANPLQLLTWNHKKGYYCAPHFHKPIKRTTQTLNECFVVLRGKVKFRLFGPDKKHFKTITLKAGDAYMYISGGHEAEVMEDCLMFEVKNGPYYVDKENLIPILAENETIDTRYWP